MKREDDRNEDYTIVLVRCFLGNKEPSESGFEELDTPNGFYFSVPCINRKEYFRIPLVVVKWREKGISCFL